MTPMEGRIFHLMKTLGRPLQRMNVAQTLLLLFVTTSLLVLVFMFNFHRLPLFYVGSQVLPKHSPVVQSVEVVFPAKSLSSDYQPEQTQVYRSSSPGSTLEREPSTRPSSHAYEEPLYENNKPDTERATCLIPRLEPFESAAFVRKQRSTRTCDAPDDWTYIENGSIRLYQKPFKQREPISCQVAPLILIDDDRVTLGDETHIANLQDGTPIESDFFRIRCNSADNTTYTKVHAGVVYNATLPPRSEQLQSNDLKYDVFMFGFDSVSHMAFKRYLPKTAKVMRALGAIELNGYNTVDDGIPKNLLALLTGTTFGGNPDVYRTGSTNVDGFPWIWEDFKRAGYVTAWGEDMSQLGTFQLSLNGFKRQSVDHYMRPYYLYTEAIEHSLKRGCVGSVPNHKCMTDWFLDMYRVYENSPKFMFGFFSQNSRADNEDLGDIDWDIAKFLLKLDSSGALDRTIFVLMSNHGARCANLRHFESGRLEESLPLFSVRMPRSFKSKYPDVMENLEKNRDRLTSAFDVHATFLDLLGFPNRSKGEGAAGEHRGISLFQEIPLNRTCEDAGIKPHNCSCLQFDDVLVNKALISIKMAQSVVDHINDVTASEKLKCEMLFMDSVQTICVAKTFHGIKDFGKEFSYYQVTFTVRPGGGLFDATVKYVLKSNTVVVSSSQISRINAYDSSSSCIASLPPDLRPYCVCR